MLESLTRSPLGVMYLEADPGRWLRPGSSFLLIQRSGVHLTLPVAQVPAPAFQRALTIMTGPSGHHSPLTHCHYACSSAAYTRLDFGQPDAVHRTVARTGPRGDGVPVSDKEKAK